MKARWELLTDEQANEIQDRGLLGLVDYSLFQTRGWGEYFRDQGWEIRRWAAFTDKGEIAALAQGSVKRFPMGFGIVWIEGGPVGDMTLWNEDLRQTIIRTTGLPRLYCRFRCDRPRDGFDALQLIQQGWARALYPLTSNLSVALDLTQTEEQFVRGLSKSWRQTLNRARKHDLVVRQWENPAIDEVCAAYASMESCKNLREQISRERVELMLRHMGERLLLYRCENAGGELLSLRGCCVLGQRSWDVLAATTEQGRQYCASYPLFYEMIAHCRTLGVRHHDLAGIDPISNPGVYLFKKGTGATPLEYLGEWDWAPSSLLRIAANAAIQLRSRRRQRQIREAPQTSPVMKEAPRQVNDGLLAARNGTDNLPKPDLSRQTAPHIKGELHDKQMGNTQ
ncbi:MAG: lipid II:glycine glycyltransferase FemX [Blastocatellia bacterium]